MAWSNLRPCAVFEFSVMLFQVFGVAALCLSRLLPPTSARWVRGGRAAFVVALIGLGLAGALCGRHDSDFGLFAGGTMTLLLIGMIVGGGPADLTETARGRVSAEPNLAS